MKIHVKDLHEIRLREPEDIYTIMRMILKRERKIDRTKEHLWVIALDTGHKILNIELVGLGTTKRVAVSPPEVFGIPLRKHANSIVIVHNHPGGSLKASDADKDITDRLIQVGFIINVPVFDHVIITEDSYFSFANSGLLRELEKSRKYALTFVYEKRMKEENERIKKEAERAKKESKEEGKQEGLKKGEELGEKNKSMEIAKLMLKKGLSVEEVHKFTGLAKPWLGRIKNQLEEEEETQDLHRLLNYSEDDLEEK